ncbi:MAG: dTDP-4-dehydrorhamnose 3,5-epimerase [Flavobacteriales bacterium]|jgi:dTDP-4-dehydrorhamnose 3,5-epimerase
MEIRTTDFRELLIVAPTVFSDDRGAFLESFNEARFRVSTGLNITFVQDNESVSKKDVIRGMHFQLPPKGQAKLVRVSKGSVLDVVVDLRKTEPTYGQHFKIVLSAENALQLFIPEGFAHGFLVLEDQTIFSYKCSNYYSKDLERSLRWDDPAFAIDWNCAEPIISDRDRSAMAWDEFESPFF